MATKTEVLEMIERLETHCRPPLMTTEARAGWLRDWCEDLQRFTVEGIGAAAKAWRSGSSAKFPQPGAFIALIPNERRDRPAAEKPKPWRPLDQAEFDALSLSDKVRHHRILADEWGRKAGPMWRGGFPLQREDMPDAWHEAKARQAEHLAESEGLQQKLIRARREDAEARAA